MINKSQIAEHISRFVNEIYDLKGVIITDSDGIQILSFFESDTQSKEENMIRVSTMAVTSINQL